ncbi:MAG TPA: D-2-hydroxyacid dehydrogenase [Spirochaetota bacterium]|nr:D-2-hydroxyacid dehydrogenase [Spirochaetota bacterium]HPJ33993.1 D-2-hydroxyacid dehydrogenase [Spirochaetota bacterium]
MKDKIVFLDSSTVDYGDIDFSGLREFGEVVVYPVTAPGEVAERCKDATIVITNKVVFGSDLISQCPNLKMIAEAATGYNNIDIDEAKRRGIIVANVPGYSTTTVAQLTMAFILSLSTNLIKYNAAAHDGTWCRSDIFTLGTWPFFDLEGKTVGIMGLGAIGGEVARLCSAFRMNVVALKRDDNSGGGTYPRVGLYDLAKESDFISVHMPLTEYSKGLINGEFFSNMKKTAFLINMARGPIVDPAALKEALVEGRIAGAAIDVMEKEPPDADDPLLNTPDLIITPHIAWASIESRRRLVNEITENIGAFRKGEKRNVVNG